MTQTKYDTLNKRKSHAFNRDVYLLGKDKQGISYWLESPNWECNWYWGFGYIETYTNGNNPAKAKDVQSHSHAKDFYPKWIGASDAILKETTFTEQEGWELADLFESFYRLKAVAEIYHQGNSGISGEVNIGLKDREAERYINNILIPKVMNRVIEILTPKKENKK